MSAIRVRRAAPHDQAALGRFGADLMRLHHKSDSRRFISTPNPEEGYGRFLVSQLSDPDSLVMVAEGEDVVGYIFATIEDTSWMDLRGPCGYIHDIYVQEDIRRRGAGAALLLAAIDWIHSRNRRQVVLMTKSGNHAARRLFERTGFRVTMHEMMLEGESPREDPTVRSKGI